MNNVVLTGHMVRDVETRTTGSGSTTARFTIAVNRNYKNKEGNYDADFISCTAFGKQAEFLEKYFHKGDSIALHGHIMTGSYNKQDGTKVYTTDVVVDNAEFNGSKSSSSAPAPSTQTTTTNKNAGGMAAYMRMSPSEDEEVPFA